MTIQSVKLLNRSTQKVFNADRCQDINLVDQLENESIEKSPRVTKTRFVVCTLAMISLVTSMMSQSVMNYCITSMVDLKTIKGNKLVSSDGSCPKPDSIIRENRTVYGYESYGSNQTNIFAETERSEQSRMNYTSSLYDGQDIILTSGPDTISNDINYNTNHKNDRFEWTIEEQSYILGGFYYSYFIFMIPGGRTAEIYGAKYILLLAVAGSGIINLLTPWMARHSLGMLIASRVLMGSIQSGIYPAMYALINRWLTMGEASIYAPMIKMSLRLGQVLASLIPGLILEWPNVFRAVGAFAIVWSILWLFIATSDPSTNRWVSETELAHIMKEKKKKTYREKSRKESAISGISTETMTQPKTNRKTPWLKIITSPSVIGLMIAKLTYNLCHAFLTVELASYLKYVHHASMQQISAISTSMFSIQVSFALFAGWLAKFMIQKRPWGLSKTCIRKIFESIATFGSGSLLLLLIFHDCNLTYVTVVLLFISLVSIFLVGGEVMLPYDLSEEYPATIMAIANSVANLSGMIVTTLTSLILGDQGGSQVRWHRVIAIIGGADILGGLLFCLMIKAEPIDFDSKPKSGLATAAVSTEDGERNPTNEFELAEPANGKVVDRTIV